MKLLREKVGRQNLYGLIYTVTEIPIEVLREIVDALINKKPIKNGWAKFIIISGILC
jgi:hypothetical protein